MRAFTTWSAFLRRAGPALVLLPALGAAALAEPREVRVGFYVTSISDIDLADGSFRIAVDAWFIDPAARFDAERDLEVVARTATVTTLDRERTPDGAGYVFARIEAQVDQRFNLGDFPFDRQTLALHLEASESTARIVFAPDAAGTRVSDFVSLQSWNITGVDVTTDVRTYDTGFGYDEPGESYAMATLSVEMERLRSPVLIDDFIGFTFALLIAAMTFLVPPKELGVRVGMATGSLFAAVFNLYRLGDTVGFRAEFGMVDNLSFLVFGAITTTLVISLVAHRLSTTRGIEQANRVDNRLGLAAILVFSVLVTLVVRSATD
ncbi:MAG: hypothetical protein H0T41_02625 [Rhodobacteraceae bacterium]|nr:hypothetical protein [Paracoccaceae bacterium]